MTKVGVKGQYQIEIGYTQGGSFHPFEESDLISLVHHQEAGGEAPKYSLTFITKDDTVASKINEGNPITIKEGIDDNNMTSSSFLPIKPTIQKTAERKVRVTAEGVLNVPDYLKTGRVRMFGAAGGVKVALDVLRSSFDLDPACVQGSDDVMNYVQPNITDQMMVREALNHAWVRGGQGWIAHAMTSDLLKNGTKPVYRVFDMDQQIQTKKAAPLWRFTNLEQGFLKTRAAAAAGKSTKPKAGSKVATQAGGVPINYNENWIYHSDTGLMNQLFGYDRTNLDYDMESTGVDTQRAILGQNRLTQSPNPMRTSVQIMAPGRFGYFGHNTHRQYQLAWNTNMVNRALFSSSLLNVSFNNAFYPLQLLDIATIILSGADPTKPNTALSGAYIITAINRSYESKTLVTTVTMTREATEGAQGSFAGTPTTQPTLPKAQVPTRTA